MKHILAPRNLHVLAQYAHTNVLLAFDYDGTLAPIVSNPAKAKMRARTKKALEQVAQRYPTAVISGRARSDVAAHLEGIELVEILGNHGLEPSPGMQRHASRIRKWMQALQRELRGIPGVSIEDKTYSVAVHYRKARAQSAAARKIREAVVGLREDCRVFGGKCVLNVLPAGTTNKGLALETLRGRQGAKALIFVGDDVTDDDVFRLQRPGKLLGIRVGRAAGRVPQYYLRDQGEVDTLLLHLASLRAPSTSRRSRAPGRSPAINRSRRRPEAAEQSSPGARRSRSAESTAST